MSAPLLLGQGLLSHLQTAGWSLLLLATQPVATRLLQLIRGPGPLQTSFRARVPASWGPHGFRSAVGSVDPSGASRRGALNQQARRAPLRRRRRRRRCLTCPGQGRRAPHRQPRGPCPLTRGALDQQAHRAPLRRRSRSTCPGLGRRALHRQPKGLRPPLPVCAGPRPGAPPRAPFGPSPLGPALRRPRRPAPRKGPAGGRPRVLGLGLRAGGHVPRRAVPARRTGRPSCRPRHPRLRAARPA
mmetsp:Transcript_44912/g.124902  ORF Transcript_44912/g.124902 Transcript_44912/m.124902 type:complete len:243 (-) Transcript_44912:582-1310(-)